jgi:hypothetical protein
MPISLSFSQGSLTTITLWLNVLGGPSVGKMKNQAKSLRADSGRIIRLLTALDRDIGHWGRESFFEEMGNRIRRGIPSHLSELCRITGMTKSLAAYLHEMGVENREGIKDVIDNLDGDMDEKYMEILREAIRGLQ